METLILKIGGTLITDKNSEDPSLDKSSLLRIAKEIAQGYKAKKCDLILVNGAGSFGHPFCVRTGIGDGIHSENDVKNFAKDLSLMNELNVIFCNALIEQGVPAAPFQPAAVSIMENRRLVKMQTGIIEKFLKLGAVPTLFGTCAFDTMQGCAILSGDEIVSFLAQKFRPARAIFATDVEGIFDRDPKAHGAKLIREITNTELLGIHHNVGHSSGIDITAGMHGKVAEILKMSATCDVISGRIEGNIAKAMTGEHVGTRIKSA